MSVHIHIRAEDVWDFFEKNKPRLAKEMIVIAENVETKYAIYLTEDRGLPLFSVCKGEFAPEYEEGAVSRTDCISTVKQLCVRYLFPIIVTDGKTETKTSRLPDEEEDSEYKWTRQDMEDEMYQREDELQLALCDFLGTVLEIPDGSSLITDFGCDFLEDVLEHFLIYLAEEMGFEIYRPMILTDDDIKADVFVEFPYNNYPDDGKPIDEKKDGAGHR